MQAADSMPRYVPLRVASGALVQPFDSHKGVYGLTFANANDCALVAVVLLGVNASREHPTSVVHIAC